MDIPAEHIHIVRPGETGTFKLDFTGALGDGESINADGTWSMPSGLTEVSKTHDASSCTIKVTVPNTPNYMWQLKCETATDQANTPEDFLYLKCEAV